MNNFQHWMIAAALALILGIVWNLQSQIDELEQRVTTFETIRIEYVAPSADGG